MEGISQLFMQILELFGIIYNTGILIWQWLSKPLIETTGSEQLEILGEIAEYTPLELMFGLGLFVILIYQLVKFIMPI